MLAQTQAEQIAALRIAALRIAALRIAALRIAALEAENAALREKLGQPPDNSGTPPSQGRKANGEGTAKPKGQAHPGAHRPLHPNPTRRRDVMAKRCSHCQADVTGVAQVPVQAYDRVEIPAITPDVTRVALYGGVCPCCARRFKATPPAGLEPGSPFGPNLRAFVLSLRFGQAIPFARLARLMGDLFGLAISEGALANLLEDSAPAFAAQTSRIKQHLLSGTVLASDETSVRVGQKTFWTWVFHHADSACFIIRPSRGKAVVREFLGAVRPAFWISDRLGAQRGWAAKEHQVCLSHLLRDAQYAIDAAFAPGLKRAVRIGRRRATAYHSRLQSALDTLLKIEPGTKAGQKLQRLIKRFRLRLHHQPGGLGHQQRLRTGPAPLRDLLLPIRVGGRPLRQCPVRTARRRGIGLLHALRLTLLGQPLPTAA